MPGPVGERGVRLFRPRLEQALEVPSHGVAIVGMDQVERLPPDHVIRSVARDRGAGRREIQQRAVGRDAGDEVRRVVGEKAVASLALRQGAIGAGQILLAAPARFEFLHEDQNETEEHQRDGAAEEQRAPALAAHRPPGFLDREADRHDQGHGLDRAVAGQALDAVDRALARKRPDLVRHDAVESLADVGDRVEVELEHAGQLRRARPQETVAADERDAAPGADLDRGEPLGESARIDRDRDHPGEASARVLEPPRERDRPSARDSVAQRPADVQAFVGRPAMNLERRGLGDVAAQRRAARRTAAFDLAARVGDGDRERELVRNGEAARPVGKVEAVRRSFELGLGEAQQLVDAVDRPLDLLLQRHRQVGDVPPCGFGHDPVAQVEVEAEAEPDDSQGHQGQHQQDEMRPASGQLGHPAPRRRGCGGRAGRGLPVRGFNHRKASPKVRPARCTPAGRRRHRT